MLKSLQLFPSLRDDKELRSFEPHTRLPNLAPKPSTLIELID